jgi:hypothetical protein
LNPNIKYIVSSYRKKSELKMDNFEFENLGKMGQNAKSHHNQFDPENPNKKDLIKIHLKEGLYNSLAQSIIKLAYTQNSFLKIFLFTFVLGSSGMASFMVIKLIAFYLSYGVVKTSRTIFENPTLFPKVTFCNVNSFATEYAYNLTQFNIYDGNSLETHREKRRLGHDLKDILIKCYFNNDDCNIATDFAWSYDQEYGNCFTFNSGFDSNGTKIELKKTKMPGPIFGLRLVLYVNIFEKLYDDKSQGLGAILRIGNSSYLKDYSNGGIFLSPGLITYIRVDREFISTLPKPYSNCEIDSGSPKFRADSDLYNLLGQTDYEYSQHLCLSQCLQMYVIKNYNCTLGYLISFYNISQCNYDIIKAFDSSSKIFESNYFNDVCLSSCPLECNQTLYKYDMSSYQLNGKSYVKNIKENLNLASDFLSRDIMSSSVSRESFVDVTIFYDSLSYIDSTESPQMDIVSLLAAIGGNLSLFLGVSVFSLCEIVEVAMNIYYILNR